MEAKFQFNRGDLVADILLGGEPYRVERCLRDCDTGVGLYVIRRTDSSTELLRSNKLIDNPEFFRRYEQPNPETNR